MTSPRAKLHWQLYCSIAVIFVGALVSGCRKPATNPDDARTAIRTALQQHLSQQSNLNLAAMDMSIGNISVNGDHAQAHVQFRLKQNNVSMDMLYDLEQHGGAWIVTHSQPSGGQFSHPPMDQAHSSSLK